MVTKAILLLPLLLATMEVRVQAAQAQQPGAGAGASQKVTVTARLVDETKRPIVGIEVMLMEAESKAGEVVTHLKIGPGGKLANPTATTDKTGRLVIEADRSFWAGTGYFTLRGGFLPGSTTNAGILRGPVNSPMLLKVEAKANRLDLGDVVVKPE